MEKFLTEQTQTHCSRCGHFQDDDRDTGYCQLHHVYVLRTYHCAKFIHMEEVVPGVKEIFPVAGR